MWHHAVSLQQQGFLVACTLCLLTAFSRRRDDYHAWKVGTIISAVKVYLKPEKLLSGFISASAIIDLGPQFTKINQMLSYKCAK